MPIVAALPAIAGGLGAASAAKSLFSGPGGSGPSGIPDPSTGFSKPINQDQINNAYYDARASVGQQQNLVNAIQAQNGLGNQSQVYNQLQDVAAGQGPNPAIAQLNNATGQNIQQQAALMASQRGVGANPALIARQAAQQGAQIQQNAVGQAAALQAQQSLNALGQAGALANTQAGNQIAATGAYTSAAQNMHQNELNAQAQYNQTLMGGNNSANDANAKLAVQRQDQLGNLTTNLAGAAGTLGGLGGKTIDTKSLTSQKAGTSTMAPGFAEGGAVTSPVMIHLTGERPMRLAVGGNVGSKLQAGGKVPGKPAVGGAVNSYANDKVKALLSPGEIVLPRSIVQGKNPQKDAAAFVGAILAKNKMRK